MAVDWLIAGLGNPGRRYDNTRHNIGFLAVDELLRDTAGQTAWRESAQAHAAQVKLHSFSVQLIKPQSFMNLSGGPIAEVMRFHKVDIGRLIVLHDDLDIAFGSVRVKQGGGDGGHNGIRSIVDCLGSKDFLRVRLGISRPPLLPSGVPKETAEYVLERFSKDEQQVLGSILKQVPEIVSVLMREGLIAAQNRFN